MADRRYCYHCGAMLRPGATFCESCGQMAMTGENRPVRRGSGSVTGPNRRPNSGNAPQTVRQPRTTDANPYRQEYMARRERSNGLNQDWQQSWQRQETKQKSHISAAQWILSGIILVLLVSIIGMGIFWQIGRTDQQKRLAALGESTTSQQMKGNDSVEILDP